MPQTDDHATASHHGGSPKPRAPACYPEGVPFNSTGEGTFPEGSAFGAGRPQPIVVVLVVAAAWCGASRRELMETLPARHAEFGPRGVEFLVVLAEGFVADERAELDDLDLLLSEVSILGFPAAVEPTYQVAEFFGAAGYPDNVLVDTRDMTIAALVSGASDEDFWAALEALLAE